MANVTWSSRALTDLSNQYQFLTEFNLEIAEKAVEVIIQSGKSLAKNPRRGNPINDTPGLRKLIVPFGKYGYTMHYIILNEEVLVLRVYHGRQNRPA